MNVGSVPALRAVTRPLSEVPADLLAYADPHQPLVWTRGDRGCVGIGEVLRLSFSGPTRFDDAAKTWRAISQAATVDDPVRLPGSGLLAFGTFTFRGVASGAASGAASDALSEPSESPSGNVAGVVRDGATERASNHERPESVLVVPRILIARHRGTAWVTEISEIGAADTATESGAELPEPTPLGEWLGTHLDTRSADFAYLKGVREATVRIEHPQTAEPGGDTNGSSLEKAIGKIVLSRQVRGKISAADDLRVPLKRLAERYDDCWTYAVDGMIGASPETLVRQTDGAISARVLAGTRGRHRDNPAADDRARDELLTSSKEQHEHSFAVQSVVTALTPHVRELHTSEEPFALRLPNVWHLATDLGAVPGDGGTSLELTAALHPTAAVAGTPTSAAVRAIAELEPFDRGRYAGPIGWIDAKGEGEWVIALRCADVGPAEDGLREVTAYAGGGIVAGSDPDHEFNETVSKFAPIADAFSA